MTDKLKNDLLKSNIQCINEYDGKFVFFHGNYFSNTSGSAIYRFSSGIILDSSSEIVQYKIVLGTYNVKTAKVTFVEKVLQ